MALAFIADGDRVLWCAGPHRIALTCAQVEQLIGFFLDDGSAAARSLYFTLHDANVAAGGISRVHPFRKVA